MEIGSRGFQGYSRTLADSLNNTRSEADPREAQRKKLREAMATLPWSIPAAPDAESDPR